MSPSFWNTSMGAEISQAPEKRVRHPDIGYDLGDLPHGPVFAFFIVLAALVLLVQVSLWGVFRYLGQPEFAGHASTNPIMTSKEELREVGGDPALAFPKPTLQPNPVADLNKFRALEEDELNSYGWVDASAQKIRIPIERAIDQMSESWPNQQTTDEGEELAPPLSAPGAQNANPAKQTHSGGAYGR